jgi:hypothetical protein
VPAAGPLLCAFASKYLLDIKRKFMHISQTRTTIAIDDDLFDIVARQAKLRGVSIGRTVSDLLRRGLSAPTPTCAKSGVTVFQLPADSPKVTPQDVRRIEVEGL